LKDIRQKFDVTPKSSTSVGMKGCKREDVFIKDNIPRNINPTLLRL
jgi:hypothetical protein